MNPSRHERMCVTSTPERNSARMDVAMTDGSVVPSHPGFAASLVGRLR